MMADNHNINNLERVLYHGTDKQVIVSIAEKGFDWRLCGKNATLYGQGTYFAKSASLSHEYTDVNQGRKKRFRRRLKKNQPVSLVSENSLWDQQNEMRDILRTSGSQDLLSVFTREASCATRFMFVANVLVGQSAPGSPNIRCPPPLDKNKPHGKLYDSCIDDVDEPEKFVIFDHYQSYPSYVVEYSITA